MFEGILAISKNGNRSAQKDGATPIVCLTSSALKPGKTGKTLIAAATVPLACLAAIIWRAIRFMKPLSMQV